MKCTLLVKLVALLALSVSSSTFASTIYTDSTSFNAVLSSTVVDDYQNPAYVFIQDNATMSAVLGETKYQSTGFNNLNIVPGYYCAGCNGSFKLDFTSTSVSDASGVFGVGFNFFNIGNPSFDAFVTYGNGTTENIALGNQGWMAFWGITSSLEIASIDFGLPNGGYTTYGSFGIDDLTIGNQGYTNVPEPSALLIFGLGLAGLAFKRRRKVN